MWLFTRYGFYSVVCARTEAGADRKTVVVRARSLEHLEKLRQRFPALVKAEPSETPESDYPFRLTLSKSAWVSVASELAKEVDWVNFRNEVSAHQGDAGEYYLDAIHDVWDRMAHL